MTIYFAGSIRGGRDDQHLYATIIQLLQTHGAVLTEHIADPALSALGEDGPNDRFIHDRDMQWLLAADCIIAEVTTPSLGVGYELGRAVEARKPTLCLYRPQPGRRLSAMLTGSPLITTIEYTSPFELPAILQDWFTSMKTD